MPKLTIAGPNLTSGATFHVHKAGCRDLKSRAKGYGPNVDADTGEYASVQEIIEEIYSDHMAENEAGSDFATWQAYEGEFDIFPCVGPLPLETLTESDQVKEEIQESSLPTSPESDKLDSSKAAPTKGRSRKAKEAPKVSTKTETKTETKTNTTRRTWNKNQARMVNSRRNKGMSWRQIGDELGFSPRTVRSMFDAVNGQDAHFDSRLPGKGGRTRSGVSEAKAKMAEQD